MKKENRIILFILILCTVFLLFSFVVVYNMMHLKAAPESQTEQDSSVEYPEKKYTVSDLDPVLTWVNYSEQGFKDLLVNAMPNKYMAYGSKQALVSVLIKNQEELAGFTEKVQDRFSLDADFDNENGKYVSFTEHSEKYNEAFFKEKTLVITYIPANSGSIRFSLEAAYLTGEELEIKVKTEMPQAGTCDMAGWFLLTEFPAGDVKNIKAVNAWK